jgi:hypothetical protein
MTGRGDFFLDDRERVLRVTDHPDEGCITLSIWDGASCVATFRLRAADAGRLHALVEAAAARIEGVTRRS